MQLLQYNDKIFSTKPHEIIFQRISAVLMWSVSRSINLWVSLMLKLHPQLKLIRTALLAESHIAQGRININSIYYAIYSAFIVSLLIYFL